MMVSATCREHGLVVFKSQQVVLVMGELCFYSFPCARGKHVVAEEADDRIVHMLVTVAGLVPVHLVVRAHHGPALTLDDLLDLQLELSDL